jgi:hypothetical protein
MADCGASPITYVVNVIPLGVILFRHCGRRQTVRLPCRDLYAQAAAQRCEVCGSRRHHAWTPEAH